MTSKLEKAIEHLYLAFGDVPKPDKIEGCPCCLEGVQGDVLLAKPLREISPEDLGKYASSVFLTFGALPDFLYFLPRLLEIAATDLEWWPGPEVLGRALKDARFQSWSIPHTGAFVLYLDAVLDEAVARENAGGWIDSWICAWGKMYDDITPGLERLIPHPAQVLSYYEYNSACLAKGKLSNSFWDHSSPTYRQTLDWFHSRKVQNIIKSAYGL